MDRLKLKVENRKVEGRKVKTLRRDGILPANVFGKKIKSFAVQLPIKEFMAVYKEVGETGLVDLQADGEIRPVLVSNVQYHPVTDAPLHVDFRQVDLKEKIQAPVPVEIEGESPAAASGIGILVQQITEIEVEALPTDLPESIIVDITDLANVDDAIHVKDLKVDRSKITLLAGDEEIVVKIEPPAVEEVAEPAAAPGGEEGGPPAGGTEGEGASEGGAEGAESPAAEGEDKKEE